MREFNGKLVEVFVDRQGGYSVPEIYTGIKSGEAAPGGLHVHGGNGTYADYSHSDYVEVNNRIMGVFEVHCEYYRDGQKVAEECRKTVDLGLFAERYHEKRATIMGLVADALSSTFYKLGVECKYTLTHEENIQTGRKEWDLKGKGAVYQAVCQMYRDLTAILADKKYTLKDIHNNREMLIEKVADMYAAGVRAHQNSK